MPGFASNKPLSAEQLEAKNAWLEQSKTHQASRIKYLENQAEIERLIADRQERTIANQDRKAHESELEIARLKELNKSLPPRRPEPEAELQRTQKKLREVSEELAFLQTLKDGPHLQAKLADRESQIQELSAKVTDLEGFKHLVSLFFYKNTILLCGAKEPGAVSGANMQAPGTTPTLPSSVPKSTFLLC